VKAAATVTVVRLPITSLLPLRCRRARRCRRRRWAGKIEHRPGHRDNDLADVDGIDSDQAGDFSNIPESMNRAVCVPNAMPKSPPMSKAKSVCPRRCRRSARLRS
jgi:hypothetical protein